MGQVAGIYRRRSMRKYLNEELQVGILDEIKEASKNVKKLYEDIDMDIHIVEDGIRFQNIISSIFGGWFKIRAPHYIVVTSSRSEGYLENAGFALEPLVLSLTDMGIGTCFVNRSINHQLLKTIIPVKEGQEAVIVLSFGYPRNEENKPKRKIIQRKRLDIDEFTSGNITKSWQHILDSIRIIPLYGNTKSWRFFINKNIIDIYLKNRNNIFRKKLREMNLITLGTALYHLYMTGKGLDKEIEIKRFKVNKKEGYTYITSVIENIEN